MKQLLAALIKAKAEFLPIKKDKINPHFKQKYADLDSILSAVEPALLINKLVLSQTIETAENGMTLITTLWHESGENMVSRYALPQLSDSQKFGSALTYARRYAVSALLSVTADDDDDGNGSISQVQQLRPKSDLEREQLMDESGKLFASLGMKGSQAQEFINEHFGVLKRDNLDNQKLRLLIEKLQQQRMTSVG